MDEDPSHFSQLTRIFKIDGVGHRTDEIVVTTFALLNDTQTEKTLIPNVEAIAARRGVATRATAPTELHWHTQVTRVARSDNIPFT